MSHYDILRQNGEGEWIHVRYAGKTKAKALEVLTTIAKYKHHKGITFRVVRTPTPADSIL